jgi:endoglucanase
MAKLVVCCSLLLWPSLMGTLALSSLAQSPNPMPSSLESTQSRMAAPAITEPTVTEPTTTEPTTAEVLEQSWAAYRQRFIQADGRVIDWEQNGRTVSEGQAYAMLRAVFADDPATFAQTLKWAEDNLRRVDPQSGSQPIDALWAWKWGQSDQGSWGILDANFASDADLDAITALILADRRWNRPDYLDLARTKLKDLWQFSTVTAPPTGQRYFLPGPVAAFQPQPPVAYLNPSYLAPYAFRLFAQVDPDRDWLSLVESSYDVLEESTALSAVDLPSDWVALNLTTGQFEAPPIRTRLRSTYSFDAYRVWWRVALDAVWFNEPKAKTFLKNHLGHLQTLWQTNQAIPARISLRGTATARYEATSQYAMLYPAFQLIDPAVAEEMWQQKLLPTYKDGIWDNDSAYYVQNLAWLGLFPAAEMQAWVRGR